MTSRIEKMARRLDNSELQVEIYGSKTIFKGMVSVPVHVVGETVSLLRECEKVLRDIRDLECGATAETNPAYCAQNDLRKRICALLE